MVGLLKLGMKCPKGKGYDLWWVSTSGQPEDGARQGEQIRKEGRFKEILRSLLCEGHLTYS